jgi:hypothetical protein
MILGSSDCANVSMMPPSVVTGMTRWAVPAYAMSAVFAPRRCCRTSCTFCTLRARRLGATSSVAIDGVTFTTMAIGAVSSAKGDGSRRHVGPAVASVVSVQPTSDEHERRVTRRAIALRHR